MSTPRPNSLWWGLALAVLGTATVALHMRLASLCAAGGDVPTLLAYFGIAFLLYLGGVFVARRLRHLPGPVLTWLFVVAAASMVSYWNAPGVLSPEVNRYRWDGLVAEAGFNPYEVAPRDPELANLRAAFPDSIPNPSRSGLYPPLAEFLFYGMARMDWNSVLHFRMLLTAAALLVGLALLPLCRAAGVPAVHAAFLLWHPLFLLETAGNAHIEALGLLFLLASLALLLGRHQLTPLTTLALSVLTKAVPVAILPLYLRRIPIYRVLLFFLVLALGTFPFIAAGPRLLGGLLDYAGHARFNPGLFLLVEKLVGWAGQAGWARVVSAGVGLGMALAVYFTDDGSDASILRRAFYLALPPILFGPVVNPWYLVWLLPFLALLPRENPFRMPIMFLSGSVALSYLHLAWGAIPGWVTALEYVPVALLFAWGLVRRRITRSTSRRPGRQAPLDR